MKKLVALLLAAVMCLSLAACGSKKEAPESESSETESKEQDIVAQNDAAANIAGEYYCFKFSLDMNNKTKEDAEMVMTIQSDGSCTIGEHMCTVSLLPDKPVACYDTKIEKNGEYFSYGTSHMHYEIKDPESNVDELQFICMSTRFSDNVLGNDILYIKYLGEDYTCVNVNADLLS